jgi:hypothetical protein
MFQLKTDLILKHMDSAFLTVILVSFSFLGMLQGLKSMTFNFKIPGHYWRIGPSAEDLRCSHYLSGLTYHLSIKRSMDACKQSKKKIQN